MSNVGEIIWMDQFRAFKNSFAIFCPTLGNFASPNR